MNIQNISQRSAQLDQSISNRISSFALQSKMYGRAILVLKITFGSIFSLLYYYQSHLIFIVIKNNS
jgi:hypothetical protein